MSRLSGREVIIRLGRCLRFVRLEAGFRYAFFLLYTLCVWGVAITITWTKALPWCCFYREVKSFAQDHVGGK